MMIHGGNGDEQQHLGRTPAPSLVYDGPVDVALVDAGSDPAAVARALHEMLLLTISNPDALDEATPLILFTELKRPIADQVRTTLERAGAGIELRAPHTPSSSFRFKASLRT